MIMISMVTSTPNALVMESHPDRSPVILDFADHAQWLIGTPAEAIAKLTPFPAAPMVIHQSFKRLETDPDGLDLGHGAPAARRLFQDVK